MTMKSPLSLPTMPTCRQAGRQAGRLTVSAARIQVFARGQRGDGLVQRGYVL